MPERLDHATLVARLGDFPEWSINDTGKLTRTFKFPDFAAAFGFLTSIAIDAEKINHHPEVFNRYSTVRLDLSTHDVGGITELDFKLMECIEKRLSAIE